MAETFSLETDTEGRLILKRPGQDDASDVRIRRAFPWTNPSRNVSVRSKEGKELLLVEDLNDLPGELRTTISQWLEATSFIPKITRVVDVDVRFGFQQWKVLTDRGPAEFRVQEREDIRFMPDGRFSVKDADGNLYELGSLQSLDETSRRAIESLV
jgi:hypothetical protein